jgi:hypothetical protein
MGISCRQTSNITNQDTNFTDSLLQKRIAHYTETVYPVLARSVQTGYLVTRMGRDITSQLMSKLNIKDSSFSHCGIIIVEKDTPYVYHCIGGEFNPDQKMKRERLIDFSSPIDAKRIGVFQPDITANEKDSLVNIINVWYKAAIPFDMDFRLDTDQKMYCSEMITKAFERATDYRCRIETRMIENFEFIPVENTYSTPWMKEKLRMAY